MMRRCLIPVVGLRILIDKIEFDLADGKLFDLLSPAQDEPNDDACFGIDPALDPLRQ